jgi:glutaminyl-peptide cyclotransferase
MTPLTGTSRHLAEKWSTAYIDPHSKRRLLRDPVATELSTIEHMVLLDLLGAANPSIRSYFPDTGWLYDQLIDAERRLGENGYFNQDGQASNDWKSWFFKRSGQEDVFGGIEDDHLPFLQRGVNILHLIPNPFPTVWHQISVRSQAMFFFLSLTGSAGRRFCARSIIHATLEHPASRFLI